MEDDREVPSREEIERLFSKLPEGKYVWFVPAGNDNKWACWVAPFLMAGKAKVSEDGWKGIEGGWHCIARHPLGVEFWGSDCGNLAWKMPPKIKDWPDTLDEKSYELVCDTVMKGLKQIIEKNLVKFVRAH
jgi:hypothetical protein